MTTSARSRLVVMAKAPDPGLAKTRLAPALGSDGAARLAARLLEHALDAARRAAFDELLLACAPDKAHAAFAAQQRRGGVTLVAQGDGDLGARMRRQFTQAFVQQVGRVVVIGCDAPALDAERLREADRVLARDDVDAVFVPAADGGYALIGLCREAPQLFDAMPWSSDRVMGLTRQRAVAVGLRCVELSPVHDIDEPADLRHVPAGWL